MQAHTSRLRRIPTEQLKIAVASCCCMVQLLSYLGFCPTSGSMAKLVKKRLQKENIDINHFVLITDRRRAGGKERIKLEDILVENSTYNNRFMIKKKLISSGLVENKCSVCGCPPNWNGLPLVLQLDHINGIYNDNRLENLRLICPNCHSQTETFSGKNSNRHIESTNKKVTKEHKTRQGGGEVNPKGL